MIGGRIALLGAAGRQDTGFLGQYPGTVAAYSLRRLSDYTQSVVKVRRSSDNALQNFAPEEVTNGTLAAWVGAGNNGFVHTWFNQVSGGVDAVQTVDASQPSIVSNGSVITFFGRPSVQVSGSQLLDCDNLVAVFNLANNFTFFTLQHPTSSSVGHLTLGFGNSTNSSPLFYVSTTTSSGFADIRDNANTLRRISIAAANVSGLFCYQGLATCTLSRNGTSIGTIAKPTGAIGVNRVKLFGRIFNVISTFYGHGYGSEVILYGSDQSANKSAIEQNISSYYTI